MNAHVDPIAPDEAAVRTFFQVLHEAAGIATEGMREPGVLQLSRVHPADGKLQVVGRFRVGDVERMTAQAVADASAGFNVYTEGRTVRPDLHRSKRGDLVDTVAVFALVVDADADKGRDATLPDEAEPSLCVESSPGNRHEWFFIAPALPAAEAQALGAAIRAAGGGDDDTGNVTQPYRVAGTPNYPGAKKEARGRVVSPTSIVTEGRSYTADELRTIFPATPTATRPATSVQTAPVGPDHAARPVDALLASLSSKRTEDLAATGVADRSAHVLRVTGWLKGDGYSLDEAVALWEAFPAGAAADKYGERLEREVARIWNKVSDDPAAEAEAVELGRAAAERIAANLAKGDGDSASPAPARAGLPVLIEDSDGNVHDETGALVYAAKKRDEAFQVATGGDWVQTSGLIGEIADWICDTARRPNRPLAVAAAIVTIGTMCGRHISTPTGCGTHLYVGCIGASTIGKDRPLKAIPRLLEAVGLPNLAVTGKFKSDGAIEKILIDAPCCCAIVDEMGTNLFAKMSHARASTHEQGIGGVLRELWSTSFERWQGYARAGGGAVSIASPAFSIFGASTIDEFYNSLAKGVVENGFLNRFTLIRAAPRSAPQTVDVSAVRAVPQSIVEGLADLMPTGGGNLQSGAQGYSPYTEPELRTVEFVAPEVEQAFLAFEESLLAKMDAAPEIAPYLGRTAEMTIRLATIHAVSKLGTMAAVRLEDLQWGMAVATESAQTMIDDVRDRIQEGDYQRKYRKVLSIISDATVITKRDLTRKLNGLLMKREVDDILSSLEDSGVIAQEKTSGRGRPSCIITYTDVGGARA